MRKPNVIVILADDMGYGDFGAFGDGVPQTPCLDSLVADGLTLTQHYSASPVSAPARAALLTGRYPHRTGVIDTLEGRGLDRLALGEQTIANVFKDAGYATGLIGKWHLGALDPAYHPCARGFDEFAGFRGGWSDYYEWRLDCNGEMRESNGEYLTDVLADEAVGFISKHKDKPFFLHVAFNAPHFPFQVPEEELALFAEPNQLTEAVRTIYAMIRRMDRGVGRILGALESAGLVEDTIVLFTSDNGPQFGGEGERCTNRYNANLRGYKTLVFEGGIRVPAVIRWPGVIEPGTTSHEFVHFTDWLPTLATLAGVNVVTNLPLDGKDVTMALKGEAAEGKPKRFWQWNRYTPVVECNAAMRDGEWKLVRPAIDEAMRVIPEDISVDRGLKYEPGRYRDISRSPLPDYPRICGHKPLLFNLAEDPYEEHDLPEAEPERLSVMLAELTKWFGEVDGERRRNL